VENQFNLIGDYSRHDAFGQAGSLLSVIIVHRRQMRVTADDLNTHVLPGYTQAILALVSHHINQLTSRQRRVDMTNYGFIVNTAQQLVEACRDDRNADEQVVDRCLDELSRGWRDMQGAVGPGGAEQHPTPAEINRRFDQEIAGMAHTVIREKVVGDKSVGRDDGTSQPDAAGPGPSEASGAPGRPGPAPSRPSPAPTTPTPARPAPPRPAPVRPGTTGRPGASVGPQPSLVAPFIVMLICLAICGALWWWVFAGPQRWWEIIIATLASLFLLAPVPLMLIGLHQRRQARR
jgi:hypothetical protein